MMKLLKSYNQTVIKDCGSEMSTEAKKFAKDFKKWFSKNIKERSIELVSFSIGHYDFSGFVKKNEKYVYFAYDIPRYGLPVNFFASDCRNVFLVRTAKHEKDYTGGPNTFTDLEGLLDRIEKLVRM